jgi:iron transport multicopper oxidase
VISWFWLFPIVVSASFLFRCLLLSIMSFILFFFALFSSSLAKTVTYNFDITWVNAAPDGFSRPVIGINKQWPLPTIEADLGDTVVVKTRNLLSNETTSIHFHGMHQVGTSPSDGPVGVSQCSIPPGGEYTYQFTASPAGTFWYHSHDKGQYPDGLRGQMIVHDRAWEKSLGVDEQIHYSVSDWYHEQMPILLHKFLSPDNPNGILPTPDALLVNDSATPPDIVFEPGKKYLLRIVNMAAVVCSSIQFRKWSFISYRDAVTDWWLTGVEDHDMTVVGIDGVHGKLRLPSAHVADGDTNTLR